MSRRRIILRKARAQSAGRRIMFTSPAAFLVDGGPDFDLPMSSAVFDVLAKSAADAQMGALTPDGEDRAYAAREALGRAADALCCGKPVPVESRWAAVLVHEAGQAK